MSSSVIETIKEVVSNMNSGLYDFTVDGKCSECGSCCSNFIPISSKEIKQIKWYIRKHHIKECRHNFTASLMDLTCPFLMDDKAKEKCSIYLLDRRYANHLSAMTHREPERTKL